MYWSTLSIHSTLCLMYQVPFAPQRCGRQPKPTKLNLAYGISSPVRLHPRMYVSHLLFCIHSSLMDLVYTSQPSLLTPNLFVHLRRRGSCLSHGLNGWTNSTNKLYIYQAVLRLATNCRTLALTKQVPGVFTNLAVFSLSQVYERGSGSRLGSFQYISYVFSDRN